MSAEVSAGVTAEPDGGPGPWRALVTGPRLTRVGVALVAAAVLGAACLAFGLGPWRATTVAAAAAAAGLVAAALPAQPPLTWPVDPVTGGEGARPELLYLALGLQPRQGRVGQTGFARVQALGRDRLRRRGLQLDRTEDGPAIEQLVGRAALDVLLTRADPLPTARALLHCVERLEALAPAGPGGAEAQHPRTPTSTRRTRAR